MKYNTLKRTAHLAVVLSLAIGAAAPLANAQQQDLRTFLVGKWRLPTATGSIETVFQATGAFKNTIYIRGINEPAYLSGGWEIRNGNQLWTHNLAWYPIFDRHYDGTRTRIRIEPWDSTKVEIIDANHVRTSGGVSTRIK